MAYQGMMNSGLPKVTDVQVEEILLSPLSLRACSKKYGLSVPQLSRIRNGKSFKHVFVRLYPKIIAKFGVNDGSIKEVPIEGRRKIPTEPTVIKHREAKSAPSESKADPLHVVKEWLSCHLYGSDAEGGETPAVVCYQSFRKFMSDSEDVTHMDDVEFEAHLAALGVKPRRAQVEGVIVRVLPIVLVV